MNASNVERRPPHAVRRFLGRLKYPLIILALCMLIGLLLTRTIWIEPALKSWSWRRDIQANLERAKTNGWPVTLEQLQDYYTTTPERIQTASRLTNAFALFESADDVPILGKEEMPAVGVPLTADQRDRIRACLERNARCLALLTTALTTNGCRYPVDFTDGYAALMPYIPKIKVCGGLFALGAMHRADGGDGAGAVRSLQSCLDLAATLDDEPTLISYLIQTTVLLRATRTLEWCLSRCELPVEDLRELEKRLRQFLSDRGYRRALQGERCMGISIFQAPTSTLTELMQDDSLGVRFGFFVYGTAGYKTRDLSFYLGVLQQVQDLQDLDAHFRLELTEDLRQQVAENKAQERKLDINIISGMLLPGLLKAPDKEVGRQAEIRLAIAALKLTCGPVGEAEGGGVDGTFLDPYDGQPLRVLETENGWAIYSVGPDQSDDQGRPKHSGREGIPYDIMFAVPR